jgi:hypothetical protein
MKKLAENWSDVPQVPNVGESQAKEKIPLIQVYPPSKFRAHDPDAEPVLVGDHHITKGEIFAIAGEPGVGKSRLAMSLAIAGATGQPWLGLKVHCKFKTLIIQNENGRYRLKRDLDEIGEIEGLDEYIRISEPPPEGLNFSSPEFCQSLAKIIEEFKPDIVCVDPWNAVAIDDGQRDYSEAFQRIAAVFPVGVNRPALGIIAHTRKPSTGERRKGGTGMMHVIAGSHILASRPRCIWVIVRGSQDENDDVVVVFNPKNSNGENRERSAWRRRNGLFEPIDDFDWDEFDESSEGRQTITKEDVKAALKGMRMFRKEAVQALMEHAGFKERACYTALKRNGRFGAYLGEEKDKIYWKE